jgi:hypothetical protein
MVSFNDTLHIGILLILCELWALVANGASVSMTLGGMHYEIIVGVVAIYGGYEGRSKHFYFFVGNN